MSIKYGIDRSNEENPVNTASEMVCIFGPGMQTKNVTDALWFENLTECRDYIDSQLHPEDAEQDTVKFKNKVRELRNILKSIQQNKSNKDDDVEYVKAAVTSVLNSVCTTGNACTPISITDILTSMATKNSKLNKEKQKNIYAIPGVVWRQVFTELYDQGYISITTLLLGNEQVLCIVPLKPYNWLV